MKQVLVDLFVILLTILLFLIGMTQFGNQPAKKSHSLFIMTSKSVQLTGYNIQKYVY